MRPLDSAGSFLSVHTKPQRHQHEGKSVLFSLSLTGLAVLLKIVLICLFIVL